MTDPETVGPKFDHLDDIKTAILRRSKLATEIDGETVFFYPIGGTDRAEDCARHGTDFIVLFEHRGARYGERWQDVCTTLPERRWRKMEKR